MQGMLGTIDISDIDERKCLTWKIPQFFQASNNTIRKYGTPISIYQKDWVLIAFPRGIDGNSPEYVIFGLTVRLEHPDSDFYVDLLLDVEGCEVQLQATKRFDVQKLWSWRCESVRLRTKLHDDVLRGILVVYGKEANSNLSSIADAACQTTFMCDSIYFRRDFEDLLLSEKNSDACIEVQGRLFKVHKLILEACSPVFSVIFNNNITMINKNIVKVDDSDPDTFQNFLKCLYSGKLENISPDSLIGLYKLSNKYCVLDIKEKCSDLMVKGLSEYTVFEVLAVADVCTDAQLKSYTEAFLIKNVKMILGTATWKKLQMENPLLASKILTRIIEGYDF